MIKENGGKFCQRPTASQLGAVLRVYEPPSEKPRANSKAPARSTKPKQPALPLEIANIIKADKTDIIRPSYIADSVAAGKRLPLSKQYFFHRSESKRRTEQEDEEYDDSGEDDRMDTTEPEPSTPKQETAASPSIHRDEPDLTSSATSQPQSEWLMVNEKDTAAQSRYRDAEADESETEDEDEPYDVDAKGEDWELVSNGKSTGAIENSMTMLDMSVPTMKTQETRMGDEEAMEYNQDKIFDQMRFYLDTPQNARENNMTSAAEDEDAIMNGFRETARIITENGGQVVGLTDPKLTHIVLDKRDLSRQRELRKRTSQPRHRHLVFNEYVTASIESGTPEDEAAYGP